MGIIMRRVQSLFFNTPLSLPETCLASLLAYKLYTTINDDFDTTTASMLKLSFRLIGHCLKKPTFYVLELVCLASLFVILSVKVCKIQ